MHIVHLVFRTLQNTTTLMANYYQVHLNHTRPTSAIKALQPTQNVDRPTSLICLEHFGPNHTSHI